MTGLVAEVAVGVEEGEVLRAGEITMTLDLEASEVLAEDVEGGGGEDGEIEMITPSLNQSMEYLDSATSLGQRKN